MTEKKEEVKKEVKEVKTIDAGVVSTKKSYREFKALIEKYKVKNPVKFEMKKEALEKQLSALK